MTRKVIAKRKKKHKSITALKKDLWKPFALYNKLVHSVDGRFCNCFTCDRVIEIGTSGCHLGHFISKAAYPVYYFDERAVRPQCYFCNVNLGGNELVFYKNLCDHIGQDEVDYMFENRFQKVKRTREYYEMEIPRYQELVKFQQQAIYA